LTKWAKGRVVTEEQALDIGIAIAIALKSLESEGIVHRDIKPGNILFLTEDPEEIDVVLADFGIAHIAHTTNDASKTATGMMMGTPAYMPLEQIQDSSSVDRRTDIYALGVVLYRILTGKAAFPGKGTMEIITEILKSKSPPEVQTLRPDISKKLSDIIFRSMAREPNDRYQAAEHFRGALDRHRGRMVGSRTTFDYRGLDLDDTGE